MRYRVTTTVEAQEVRTGDDVWEVVEASRLPVMWDGTHLADCPYAARIERLLPALAAYDALRGVYE